MDGLLAEFNAATTPEQAKAVIDKLQAYTWKQLSVITLSQSKLYAAYTPRLKGYGDFYRIFWNFLAGGGMTESCCAGCATWRSSWSSSAR